MRRPPDPGQQPDPNLMSEQDHLKALQHARQTRVAKAVVILVLLAYLIAFIAENTTRAPIHFVLFSHSAHLIWVMLVCVVIGAVIGFLIGRPGKQIGRHRKEAKKPK